MPPVAADFEKVTLDNDTHAPMEVDIAKDGRVFYIELNRGEVRMWSPQSQTSTVVGTIPVATVHENGLLGIQLSPDFATTGHIYLAYATLPDAGRERFRHQPHLALHADRQHARPGAGDLHLEAPACAVLPQRRLARLRARRLALPLHRRQHQPVRARLQPDSTSVPAAQAWDAQRTSANTNDPNGKILRIKPIPNATGVPGIGTTYTIPDGNLFPESQDTQNKTLPEIFAMGFRNPFRIHVDQKTGWVLMGDYGPDAGSANPTRGPQGSVEFNVVKQPGFYGWPYCIRENVPYHDITYTADNGAGTDNGVYNCNAPVNDSPNNTGLTNLPPAIPATMWEAYTEADARFPDLGTGGAPTGGPRYYFDEASDSETKFPRFYDGQWFIGEWNNDWVKTTTLNNEGLATGVACFAICTGYSSPHDMEFGPDGSLYIIEWGQGFAEDNADSGLYRIDYVSGARSPIANATVDNDAVPVGATVNFSSAGSNDPDGTPLTYLWNFDDGTPTSTAANPSHTFTAAGTYDVTLTVTDASGDTRGRHRDRGRRQPAAGGHDRDTGERQGRGLRRHDPVQGLGCRPGRRRRDRLQQGPARVQARA